MTSRIRTILVLMLFTSLTIWAQTAAPAKPATKAAPTGHAAKPATAKSAAPTIVFEKYKLKNGLEVILSQDHRLPMVATNLWYHVGPANEKEGRTGFAHLFEHMMFQGSKHAGEKNHFKILEGAGASDINGTTDFDRINYFETLPSNQLELALWLESDRMGYLLDTLDQRKLTNQIDVVRNERRQSVENAPYGLVEEGMYHQLFPKGHPYYAEVIGSHEDIEAAKLNDVRDFFKYYYAPNNASLAIVGDFDPVKAKTLVQKYFGSIPSGPPVPPIDAKTPAITSERRATITDQVELPRLYMGWITSPIYKPGDAELDLFARILGTGKTSRLYRRLIYQDQIAQSVTTQQYSLILGSVFDIEVTAKPGVKLEQIEAVVNDELDKLRKEGPTKDEVDSARNVIESTIIRRLETLGGFGGVADRLNQYNHYLHNPGYLGNDLARYDKATPEGIRKAADAQLTKDSRVVVYGVPGEKVIDDVKRVSGTEGELKDEAMAGSMPEEAWRSQQPKPAAASALHLPVPERFQLPNGLSVYLLERHNLPVVSAGLYVLAGSDANPKDRPGLSAFTSDMLDEGTEKRSTLQLAEDVDRLGATLATSAGPDSAQANIGVLKRNVDKTFDLLADVVLHPAFSEKEVDRVRKQRLTSLVQQRDSPNQIANRVLYRELFGAEHPYGYIDLGTEASINSITHADLAGFWKKRYVPANSALIVAGDLTLAELRTLATKYFGGWTGTGDKATPPPDPGESTRRIVLVDKPGAPQTALRIGRPGARRNTPDYVSLEVMNNGLGGLFSSRINMNLREEHGYTYGAFSFFPYRRGTGIFVIGSGVRTDVTAPAISEVFKEVVRMRDTEMTPQEFQLSRDALSRSLPGLFETSGNAVNELRTIYVYGLPLDYYRNLPTAIDKVTPADVRRVAKKYLLPETLVVVGVGDRKKIGPEIEKLNLGPVEFRDQDGNPAK